MGAHEVLVPMLRRALLPLHAVDGSAATVVEVLSCMCPWLQVPYNDMTPLQAAVGVVQKGLRPGIPAGCPPVLADLMTAAWAQSPSSRPAFRELTPRLMAMMEAARDEEARQVAAARAGMAASGGPAGGLMARLGLK